MLIGDSGAPLATYPTSFDGQPVEGWCVYIGGDAYHVWTAAEIAHLKAQPWCRYILPIYVRSNPAGAAQATADVAAVIAWAKANGQPSGTLTQWDYETAVDATYEETVSRLLLAGDGDMELLYGSQATVEQNPIPAGGYQIADWTNVIPSSPLTMGVQFYGGSSYDMSAFRAGAALWDLRPAKTPPPPAPPEPAIIEEDPLTPDCYNVPVSDATNAAREIWALYPDGYYVHIPDAESYAGLQALGAKTGQVTWAMHQLLVARYAAQPVN